MPHTTGMPFSKSPSRQCKYSFAVDAGPSKEAVAVSAARDSGVIVWTKASGTLSTGEFEFKFKHLYPKQSRHISSFAAIPIRIDRHSEYSELVICIDSKDTAFPPNPVSWFQLIQEVMGRRFICAAYKTWSENCVTRDGGNEKTSSLRELIEPDAV